MPTYEGLGRRWLTKARGHVKAAGLPTGGELDPGILIFHAQQAAEQAIKAVLIERQVAFPKAHTIERLIGLLPADVPRPPELLAATTLSDYAVVGRYPEPGEPVSEDERRRAIALARQVIAWAEAQLGGS